MSAMWRRTAALTPLAPSAPGRRTFYARHLLTETRVNRAVEADLKRGRGPRWAPFLNPPGVRSDQLQPEVLPQFMHL